MNTTERLRELALLVTDGLTAYIQVHNRIFEDAATFKSLLKNLFGHGVSMSVLLDESKKLLPIWCSILAEVESLRRESYASLTVEEQSYFELLSRYAFAVSQTVTALIARQELMVQGSRGGRNNPMTWQAFQETEQLYKASIENYMLIGRQLNDANYIVFH